MRRSRGLFFGVGAGKMDAPAAIADGSDRTMDAAATMLPSASFRIAREGTLNDAVAVRRALDRFLAGVERRGFRLALAHLGDRDDALDAVQDAMFTLVRKYATRAEPEWTPLFWTILRSRITDTQRRRTYRNRFRSFFGGGRDDEVQGDPFDAIAGGAGEPSALLEQRGALVAVERAVRALPARQQQAFLLRVYEGLDVADAARAMGCSEGSVKTHLSRAMSVLREVLEEHV